MNNKETKLVHKFYSKNVLYEWGRLTKDPFHRLEFDTTLYFLKKYLPQKGLILDAGGGPGRYTIELAKLGYHVVLLDLVSENLKFAEEKIKEERVADKIKGLVNGSITNLSNFKNNYFDAVLCLGGPLSHVHPKSQRQKAISELIRVAKKDAPIFISVISKYGTMLATPSGWPEEVGYKKNFERFVFEGDDYRFHKNAYVHFFTLDELTGLLSKKSVKIIEKVGLEGLNFDRKVTNRFPKKFPKAWKNWLEIHRRICTEPFVVDASGHMMIIVRKK